MTDRDHADALDGVAKQLEALDELPFVEHPDVLEEIHRRLAGELDDIAACSRPPSPG